MAVTRADFATLVRSRSSLPSKGYKTRLTREAKAGSYALWHHTMNLLRLTGRISQRMGASLSQALTLAQSNTSQPNLHVIDLRYIINADCHTDMGR
jgi:hypothetical protein